MDKPGQDPPTVSRTEIFFNQIFGRANREYNEKQTIRIACGHHDWTEALFDHQGKEFSTESRGAIHRALGQEIKKSLTAENRARHGRNQIGRVHHKDRKGHKVVRFYIGKLPQSTQSFRRLRCGHRSIRCPDVTQRNPGSFSRENLRGFRKFLCRKTWIPLRCLQATNPRKISPVGEMTTSFLCVLCVLCGKFPLWLISFSLWLRLCRARFFVVAPPFSSISAGDRICPALCARPPGSAHSPSETYRAIRTGGSRRSPCANW